jgi:hypothetical protein
MSATAGGRWSQEELNRIQVAVGESLLISRARAAHNADALEDLAKELGGTVEQDWPNETTRLVLPDGVLVYSGPDCHWEAAKPSAPADVTVILDNGGGITLQVEDASGTYQRHYDEPAHAARDAIEAFKGSNVTSWEGNELEAEDHEWPDGRIGDGWLEPSVDEVCNGGYRVYSESSPEALRDALGSSLWGNGDEMAAALDAFLALDRKEAE